MYNAFAGIETSGGLGSTRLHMDIADAVNILVHANPLADGSPGCAVWDIFRPEDADILRVFLRKKYGVNQHIKDPIHSQQFYLDSDIRKELAELTGVYSYRIYQYPVSSLSGSIHPVAKLTRARTGPSCFGTRRLCASSL